MVGQTCALLEIDGLPGKTENFTLAKTENQNQDVGGVKAGRRRSRDTAL
jgi:hypothetical protein